MGRLSLVGLGRRGFESVALKRSWSLLFRAPARVFYPGVCVGGSFADLGRRIKAIFHAPWFSRPGHIERTPPSATVSLGAPHGEEKEAAMGSEEKGSFFFPFTIGRRPPSAARSPLRGYCTATPCAQTSRLCSRRWYARAMLQIALLLLPLLQPPGQLVASTYATPGDRYDNGRLACRRRLVARYGEASWRRLLEIGAAHRTLPCGTVIRLCFRRRCSAVAVVDRGPYGQVPIGCPVRAGLRGRCRWRSSARLLPGYRWRGSLDVRPPLARRLGLRGVVWTLAQPLPDR